MAEIHIRPALAADIHALIEIDHSYFTDFVWQIDRQDGTDQIQVTFRELRLPRTVRHEYPWKVMDLVDNWKYRSGLLVAVLGADPFGDAVGYLALRNENEPGTVHITDIAVDVEYRKQGVATALLLGALDWADVHARKRVIFEAPSKNYPAILLAKKMGFEFCGFSDRYFTNRDIALFFSHQVKP